MTYEEMHNYLKTFAKKRKRLFEISNEIKGIGVDGISAIQYNSPRVADSEHSTPQDRYIEKTENLKERFALLLAELFDEEDFIFEHMQKLSVFEWELVFLRFIRGLSIKAVANEMRYSTEYIHSAQRKAIQKMVSS